MQGRNLQSSFHSTDLFSLASSSSVLLASNGNRDKYSCSQTVALVSQWTVSDLSILLRIEEADGGLSAVVVGVGSIVGVATDKTSWCVSGSN